LVHSKRKIIDRLIRGWMFTALIFVLLIPLAIGLGLIVKSTPILSQYSFGELISSHKWHPMQGDFGFSPFVLSSIYVTIISFLIAGPLCLLAALYLTQYAKEWLLKIMQPVIDILAGIPSVVYGLWGLLVIVPFISEYSGPLFGIKSSGYCLLAGGIVLAVMSIPFILSILIEVFQSIPIELKEASLSVGATYWETIKYVMLREGFSGIIAACGLGISKALGETIAVLMVAGNVVQIPKSIFGPGYPLPALIANNYGEMMSVPLYDAALMFAALLLFMIILIFNILSRLVINRGETVK